MVQTEELSKAVADLDEPKVLQLIEQLTAAEPSEADLNQAIKACQDGMTEVGRRYETGEYFLAELIFAAEIARQVMEAIRPRLMVPGAERVGKVVLGTVHGDIHDIGKNIVASMLDAAGFDVYDLGIDTAPEKFVDKVRETSPQIVGMSGLLTQAIESMKETVDALDNAGLRDRVRVIIGGNPVDEVVRKRVGADRFTRSAAEGVEICKQWVGG